MSSVKFTWNKEAKKKLKTVDDEILYDIARMTLDRTYPTIPMSTLKNNSGRLRRSTMEYGVQKGDKGYTIGSNTEYASRVYQMNDSTTNWSTKGTGSKWFGKTWQKEAQIITKQAVERNMLK